MTISSYTDLEVWNVGMDLATDIYRLTAKMPKSEQYGMSSQVQRAAASVPANIAEGFQRGTRKDYARFIGIARGSLAETETFLRLAVRVGHLTQSDVTSALETADRLGQMLTRLKQRLDTAPDAP